MSRAQAAQAVDDRRDAVGLLDAQLLGAAHDGLALGEAAEQRDERQLVDGQRHLVGLDDRADQRAGGDVEVGDRLARAAISSPGSSSRSPTTIPPMRCDDPQEARARPVDVDVAR